MNGEGWFSLEVKLAKGAEPKTKTKVQMVKFLTSSKHIKVYTQKGRKRHFGLNGSGLESQFDCLQKVAFRTNIRLTTLYLNKIFKYKIDKYAGCYIALFIYLTKQFQ